jgi:hypothetical protein
MRTVAKERRVMTGTVMLWGSKEGLCRFRLTALKDIPGFPVDQGNQPAIGVIIFFIMLVSRLGL